MEDIDWTKVILAIIYAPVGAILLYKLIPKLGRLKGKIVGQEFDIDNNKNLTQFSAEQDESTDEIRKKNSDESVQSFKFSTKLQLTSYIENEVNKEGFRFRIGTINENEIFFRVELKAYLVISTLVNQPDKTSGWGRSWKDIPLNRELLPDLTGYWTVSHYFSKESPFVYVNDDKEFSEIQVYIYAVGFDKNGNRIFGSKMYKWDNNDTVFGQFQLRKLGQNRLTNEEFDHILPKDSYKKDWPLLK